MRALVYLLFLITPFSFVSASALSDSIDSTSLVKNQPDSVTKKVVSLLFEANELASEKPLSAIKNYRSALTTNKVKDDIWEANIRLAMGKLLYKVKSKDAIPQLLKADALYKKKSNLLGRAEAISEIAKIQEASGLFNEAKQNYDVLYKIQIKAGEAVLAGNTAMHLTDVYIKNKNYTEAFKYADVAKNAYYSVCRADSLGAVYYRIAHIKKKQNSLKLAEYYILGQALGYYRSSDNFIGRLKSFDFLGHLYQDQKRYSEAKWFYLQANNQARIINDTTETIKSLINLGVVKILIGDLVLAKQDITEAELLCKNEGYSYLMKNAKVKYSVLFKKLSPEFIASTTVKVASKKALKKKNLATEKVIADAVVADDEKKEKEILIEAENK